MEHRPMKLYLVRHAEYGETTANGRCKYDAIIAAARQWRARWTQIARECELLCLPKKNRQAQSNDRAAAAETPHDTPVRADGRAVRRHCNHCGGLCLRAGAPGRAGHTAGNSKHGNSRRSNKNRPCDHKSDGADHENAGNDHAESAGRNRAGRTAGGSAGRNQPLCGAERHGGRY